MHCTAAQPSCQHLGAPALTAGSVLAGEGRRQLSHCHLMKMHRYYLLLTLIGTPARNYPHQSDPALRHKEAPNQRRHCSGMLLSPPVLLLRALSTARGLGTGLLPCRCPQTGPAHPDAHPVLSTSLPAPHSHPVRGFPFGVCEQEQFHCSAHDGSGDLLLTPLPGTLHGFQTSESQGQLLEELKGGRLCVSCSKPAQR